MAEDTPEEHRLEYENEQVALDIGVATAEPTQNGYALLSSLGVMVGTFYKKENGDWEFHSTVEHSGDCIFIDLPEDVVTDLLDEIQVKRED